MTPPRDDLAAFEAMITRAEKRSGSDGGRYVDNPYGDDRQGPPIDHDALRRRRIRRRIVGGVVALLIVGLIAGYLTATLTAPVAAAASTVHRPTVAAAGAVKLAAPFAGEFAMTATGAEEYLGTAGLSAASGGADPVPIASISKLITAMVVLDRKPLGASGQGPTLTFSKADHALYDKYYVQNATIAAMPTGSTMSLHDAIEVMLVASACNYAEAVSTWAFGSQAAFLSATRSWLRQHGMTSTHIAEPTGLDARNTSTPADMLKLAALAKADPAIAKIVDEPSVQTPSLRGMPTTNPLVGVDGVDGIKTGTLDDFGASLLFSAKVDIGAKTPVSVLGVILDGGTRDSVDQAVRALLASIKAGVHPLTVAKAGDPVGTWTTPWGSSAQMVLGSDASLTTWSSTPVTVSMTPVVLGDGGDGDQVGTVTYTAGAETVHVPIVLKGRVAPPSSWWRITHPAELLLPEK